MFVHLANELHRIRVELECGAVPVRHEHERAVLDEVDIGYSVGSKSRVIIASDSNVASKLGETTSCAMLTTDKLSGRDARIRSDELRITFRN